MRQFRTGLKTPRQLTLLARSTMNKVDQEPRVLLTFDHQCLPATLEKHSELESPKNPMEPPIFSQWVAHIGLQVEIWDHLVSARVLFWKATMSCGYFNVGGLGKAWESNILIVTRTFSFVILPCKIDILNMREHGTASPFVICIYIYIYIYQYYTWFCHSPFRVSWRVWHGVRKKNSS